MRYYFYFAKRQTFEDLFYRYKEVEDVVCAMMEDGFNDYLVVGKRKVGKYMEILIWPSKVTLQF